MANTLRSYRNGAVGFIDWLGLLAAPTTWELRSAVSVERDEPGAVQLETSGATKERRFWGLLTHMKSALLAVIFGITGGVAILLAVPAEEKAPVVYSSPAKWAQEYGAPVVPQREEEVQVAEASDHYSVARAKTEKQAARRRRDVARPRPNFF